MATKITLPNLNHDWHARTDDEGELEWGCRYCAVTRGNLPVRVAMCLNRVSAWGLQMRAAGAEVERAAVVRYLIDRAEDVRSSPAAMEFTNQLATEIESGDHNQTED